MSTAKSMVKLNGDKLSWNIGWCYAINWAVCDKRILYWDCFWSRDMNWTYRKKLTFNSVYIMDKNELCSKKMVICFGCVYMFSMCLVSVQAHTGYVQNVQFRDTLCPEYVLKGRRRGTVDCGRTCASNITCRAFFFDTSGDCYVFNSAVTVTNLCVVRAGRFYEGMV